MSDFKNIFRIVRFFVREQWRFKWRLLGMVFFHPFAILFLAYLPAQIVANILQRLSTHDFQQGDVWGSFGSSIIKLLIIEFIGGVIFWRIVIYFNWSLEALVQRDINRKVFDHLMKLSASFHSNTFGGSLVSQTSKLASAYQRLTDTTIFQTLGLFWALIFTCVLLIGKAPLYVAVLVGFTLLYVACALAFTKHLRRLNAAEAEASNKQTGALADAITNVMAIKGFAAGKSESERFGITSEKVRQAAMRLMRSNIGVDAVFGTVGTIIDGAALVIAITSIVVFDADIAVVFLIVAYTRDILVRLWDFSTQALRNYNRALGDAEAMIDILAIKPEIADPAKPQKPHIKQGAIVFDDMTFAHDSSEEHALFQKLNLQIAPGEKIGLVGHSGSGKTTLTRLLLRFSDIDGGAITIDGQNIAAITQDDLRRHIAYVPQEPLLFHRSIRENIAYGMPGASNAEIEAAARKANAHEFIEQLADGYGTLVGERGVKLSGGQRQRVAIARAILKDAPILVLDEATSALDSESEVLIQGALRELMKGRTTIVIAHRLSTIQKMDRIVVLDRGTIIEQGAHAELIKTNGTYAKLWNHQSGGFIEE